MKEKITDETYEFCLLHSDTLKNWFVVADENLANTLHQVEEITEASLNDYTTFYQSNWASYNLLGNENLVRHISL